MTNSFEAIYTEKKQRKNLYEKWIFTWFLFTGPNDD